MSTIARSITRALVLLLVAAAPAVAQQTPFESVVVDLGDPEARRRIAALRALRDAGYVEAAVPVAPLLTDPVEDVRVEAINAEVAFFLVTPVRVRSRVGMVIEVRGAGLARQAFDRGPTATRPDPVPPEVIEGLIAATDTPGRRARVDAVYALGVLAGRPASPGTPRPPRAAIEALGARLGYQLAEARIAAAEVLARLFSVCGAACTPSGADGVGDALIGALNDRDQRVQAAATAALGALRYDRALAALTDRLAYYGSGDMARIALDALSRIAHPDSLTLFKARLVDRNAVLRRLATEWVTRIGDAQAIGEAEALAAVERADQVLLAAAFAQQRSGRADRLDEIINALDEATLADQAAGYLLELGPAMSARLAMRVQGASPKMRAAALGVLTMIGTEEALPALERLGIDTDPQAGPALANALAWIRARQ